MNTVLLSSAAVVVIPEAIHTLRHAVILFWDASLHLLLQGICESPIQYGMSVRVLLYKQPILNPFCCKNPLRRKGHRPLNQGDTNELQCKGFQVAVACFMRKRDGAMLYCDVPAPSNAER